MVYSIRTNRSFVTAKPLKTTHRETEYSKKLNDFMNTHEIHVETSSSGETVVRAVKIGASDE